MEEKFRAGATIAQSFAVWGRNIAPFTLLYLLLTLPGALLSFYSGIGSLDSAQPDPNLPPVESGSFWLLFLLVYLFQLFLAYLAAGAVIYGTVQDLRGRRVGLGECFSKGLSVLLPVVGVALLFTVFAGIGMLLLIIPMFFIVVIYWVCIPVAVVERPGVFASFARSAELTKGNRWRVFGLFLLYLVIFFGISLVIGVGLGALLLFDTSGTSEGLTYLINYLVQSVVGALYAVMLGVSYYRLRVDREGVDIDQIAGVFD